MDAYRDQYATLFRNGEKVTLLAVSTDPIEALASWARDADYPFALLSDPDGTVGKAFGAFEPKYGLDNRTLFVVAPGGKISYVTAPFRELDPTAYTELAEAIAATMR
ncbi:MAG: peroxiredoxin family protein [Gemmatimonadota bacterium]|nr:peroxiredoxin family protein [Gemmatimonadota bacterium]MDH4347481.1 peroxiredoxin family protein [Gemmatimonadota bacterium]MDH5283660.1 peroxiredoxin family protein [Gemmatimonadota bacterium]